MKIAELIKRFPKLLFYDYKWKDSANYRDLDELLALLGYKLVDDDIKAGDYNDIKGYFGCDIIPLEDE